MINAINSESLWSAKSSISQQKALKQNTTNNVNFGMSVNLIITKSAKKQLKYLGVPEVELRKYAQSIPTISPQHDFEVFICEERDKKLCASHYGNGFAEVNVSRGNALPSESYIRVLKKSIKWVAENNSRSIGDCAFTLKERTLNIFSKITKKFGI